VCGGSLHRFNRVITTLYLNLYQAFSINIFINILLCCCKLFINVILIHCVIVC
jgi:hypothetical protein